MVYTGSGGERMKWQVRDFAALTGVSVRTLHYYDQIGLLKPAQVDGDSGYRWYDEQSLARMQEILFYRETDFPLKSIGEMLAAPGYDRKAALRRQKELLLLKRERLERIIRTVDKALEGENVMKAFDNRDYEAARKEYEAEAKARWGGTDAYKAFEQKEEGRTESEKGGILSGMEDILDDFSACMRAGMAADSENAGQLVARLQAYITANFYPCTDKILAGLGEMYVGDERFRRNIDRHGEGTAAYIRAAIRAGKGSEK